MFRLIADALLVITGPVFRVLVVTAMLGPMALGQLDAKVTKATSLVGVSNPRMEGRVIVVDDDSQPSVMPIGIIDVESQCKFVDVEVTKDGEAVDIVQSTPLRWIITQDGSFKITVMGFDPDRGIFKKRLAVDIGKPKPPTPPPGPGPGPTPNPPPIPVAGVRVLFVYEVDDVNKYPASKRAILYGASMRSFLDRTCVKSSANVPEYRVFDKDTVAEPGIWKDALARPKTAVPWIVISNGTDGFEGPLPETESETQELIKRFVK